ncbi:hypothetical protein D3C74_420070 [compost metagenome]
MDCSESGHCRRRLPQEGNRGQHEREFRDHITFCLLQDHSRSDLHRTERIRGCHDGGELFGNVDEVT